MQFLVYSRFILRPIIIAFNRSRHASVSYIMSDCDCVLFGEERVLPYLSRLFSFCVNSDYLNILN